MTMGKGVVVPPGGGKHLEEASGQVVSMKLFGRETGESVTLFEQTVPAGSKNSWLHLHRDSDEIAWVLEGEFTFKIGEHGDEPAGRAPAPSCRATCRTPGKTAAPDQAESCSSIPRPAPATSSRRWSSGRATAISRSGWRNPAGKCSGPIPSKPGSRRRS